MASEGPLIYVETFIAGADLSAEANQYKAVIFDGSGNVVVATANTDVPIGILQNRPKSGQEAAVLIIGRSKFQADAAVTLGQRLSVSADGQFEALAAGNPTRSWFGFVLEPAGAAGRIGSGIFNFITPVAALTAN